MPNITPKSISSITLRNLRKAYEDETVTVSKADKLLSLLCHVAWLESLLTAAGVPAWVIEGREKVEGE